LMFEEDKEGGEVFVGRIPKDIVAPGSGQTHLSFEVSEIISPVSVGMNNDSRQLGLLFDWLFIQPE
jgi:hypothetical protein